MKIIYPVGRHIGIRNIEDNTMRFIKQNESVGQITGIYVSADQDKSKSRRHLAVTEQAQNPLDLNVSVTFYDMEPKSSDNKKNPDATENPPKEKDPK